MNLVICYMLPCLVAVLGAALIALREPRTTLSHDLMSAILLLLSIGIACNAQLFSPKFMHTIWFDLVYKILIPFCPALYILFIAALTSVEGISRKFVIATILPPAAYAVALISTALTLSPEETVAYMGQVIQAEGAAKPSSTTFAAMAFLGKSFFSVAFPAYVVGALLWSGFRLRNYYRMLNNFYASSTQVQRSYGWALLLILAIFIPVATFLMFVPHYASVPRWVPWTLVSMEALLLMMVSYVTYTIKFTAADLRAALESHRESVQNSVQSQTRQQIAELLETAISKDKVYLDPCLTVISFAQIIGTNRTYLQSVIKEQYECTFSEYINRCRVNHAKALIELDPRMPLKEVAVQCGFNSLSSFHRNFQEFEMKTPAQWVKELK